MPPKADGIHFRRPQIKIIGVPARCEAPGGVRGDLDWRDIINPKTKPFTA